MSFVRSVDENEEITRHFRIRSIISFWIFGLCNNFGYVVMLTAAEDILSAPQKEISTDRLCNDLSTGVILIADIVPCMLVKILFPFLPFFSKTYVCVCTVTSVLGILLVSFSGSNLIIVICGVTLISFSSGLGEITFLQYSHYYSKYTVSSWASGTGGAGLVGAFSYSLLSYFGVKTALLSILLVPLMTVVTFYYILPKAKIEIERISLEDLSNNAVRRNSNSNDTKLTFKEKLQIMPSLIPYMLPIGVVYLFEYLINQGLFELIYFEDVFLDKKEQYHWLQIIYQSGVFISRSSVNLIHINFIWIFAILQVLNFLIYLFDGLYFIVPNIWIVFILTFWEGLLGGGAYVNTFYNVSTSVPLNKRQFYLGSISLADAVGITVAGFVAIPLHNAICKLPKPERLFS